MNCVVYRSFPGESDYVQFHFMIPTGHDPYETRVKPAMDLIAVLVPIQKRWPIKGTSSYQIASEDWSQVKHVLDMHGFEVKEENSSLSGFRETSRDLPALLGFAVIIPGIALATNIFSHFFHSQNSGISIRLWMGLILLCASFVVGRFGKYVSSAVCMLLAIVLGPFNAFYIESWWLWQLLNWIALVFLICVSVTAAIAAGQERKNDLWWLALGDSPKEQHGSISR